MARSPTSAAAEPSSKYGKRSTPRPRREEAAMKGTPKITRRSFIIGTAAASGGLALGLRLRFDATEAHAATAPTEVNAWVVIKLDDTVVIRVARSEMGQGTLTGLAQLVAEELDCDWSKGTTEYPTPGQSAARKRAWGSFSTGG